MKICITSTGSKIDSLIDPRFGRCQYLVFIDTKTGKVLKSASNVNASSARQGAGITTAQMVVSEKVGAVVTGNIGPNAFQMLKDSKVKIYPGVFDLTVDKALKKFQAGKLKELKQPTVPGHFGYGPSMARGGGRGGRGGRGPRGMGAGRRSRA